MRESEQVDAVQMVRSIRDRLYEILQDKTPEEKRRFYQRQTDRFHERIRAAPRTGGRATPDHPE